MLKASSITLVTLSNTKPSLSQIHNQHKTLVLSTRSVLHRCIRNTQMKSFCKHQHITKDLSSALMLVSNPLGSFICTHSTTTIPCMNNNCYFCRNFLFIVFFFCTKRFHLARELSPRHIKLLPYFLLFSVKSCVPNLIHITHRTKRYLSRDYFTECVLYRVYFSFYLIFSLSVVTIS